MGVIVYRRGAGACLLLVFLLSGCEQKTNTGGESEFNYSGWTMGTSFSIKAPNLPERADSEVLRKKIDLLLDEINGEMSTYQEDSVLSKINTNKSEEWLAVSKSLFSVLDEAQRISRLSDGAFDITVGPLVNLWGFGPDKLATEPPSKQLIEQRLQQTGFAHLQLNVSTLSIKKLNPDIYIDLSALAKGYAVDRVAGLLEENGITDYLVEIGGELRLKGKKSDNTLWRIAIEKPTADRRMAHKILPITDMAIATSGDYRNFFEQKGVRYSHAIDPRTGYPVTHELASVTILSHTAMVADALATTLMVLGPVKGYELAEKENITALFMIKTDDGFEEKASSSFEKYLR